MTASSVHAALAGAPPLIADAMQVARLLRACDGGFVPPLSQRVDIDAYAAKLALHARHACAWHDGVLVGLVALYCNDLERHTAFITNVSVDPGHARRGIASRLLGEALALGRAAGMRAVELEVDADNTAALALYRGHGFAIAGAADGKALRMRLPLAGGQAAHSQQPMAISSNQAKP